MPTVGVVHGHGVERAEDADGDQKKREADREHLEWAEGAFQLRSVAGVLTDAVRCLILDSHRDSPSGSGCSSWVAGCSSANALRSWRSTTRSTVDALNDGEQFHVSMLHVPFGP